MAGSTPECPRCPGRLVDRGGGFWCASHGVVEPLWRPDDVGYESFAALVKSVGAIPMYLPWPMSPGWTVSDFGYVGSADHQDEAQATVTTSVGTSDLDGPVEVTVVAEDPGVGLGSRCAGLAFFDPGAQVGRDAHSVHVRAGGRSVPMWLVDSEDDEPLARCVFAGEADGRWLWLVVRPASAALLLRDEWLLADVTGFGPQALELPFGGTRPPW